MNSQLFNHISTQDVAAPSTEFFRSSTPGRAYAETNGETHNFSQTSIYNKNRIAQGVNSLPAVKPHLTKLAKANGVSVEEQFAYCFLGDKDHVSDIQGGSVVIDRKIACPQIGNCIHAKNICLSIRGELNNLSNAEIRVVAKAHYPVKEIADMLCTSTHTVKSHLQSARRKLKKVLASPTNSGLVNYATDNGLI